MSDKKQAEKASTKGEIGTLTPAQVNKRRKKKTDVQGQAKKGGK